MSDEGLIQLLFAPTAHVAETASPSEWNDVILKGLPKSAVDRIKRAMKITDPEIGALLGMCSKSVSRLWKRAPRLLGLEASSP